MKCLLRSPLGLSFLVALLGMNLVADNAAPGYVDFGKLAPPADGEFVEVNVGSNLISMVARLAANSEPDIADLLGGLQLVRVNVVGLAEDNRDAMKRRIEAIRADLDSRKWERLVTVQKPDEEVGVYLKTRGQEAVEGLVVMVVEANKQAVLINVVGNLRPEKLAEIGEKLDLDPLKKVGKALEKKTPPPTEPAK